MTTHLTENIALKRYLVLQSFAPLFALLLIKHIGHFNLIAMFFSRIFKGDWSVFALAIHSSSLGNVVVSVLCTLWLIVTFVVAAAFRGFQRVDFDHHGEVIVVGEEKKDSGVTFLVSFVLPLLVDDVGTLRGFIFFIALLAMVIVLLMRSDLFYQNPVLAALKYKTYEFTFSSPYNDVEAGKTYIGISKGSIPFDNAAIKRKYIADGVFVIYND